jgi:hypothetical protein
MNEHRWHLVRLRRHQLHQALKISARLRTLLDSASVEIFVAKPTDVAR